MDYTSTNTFFGWAHYLFAHMLTECGCKTVQEAHIAILRSCLRATMYIAGMLMADSLSDNECIMTSKKEWLKQFLWFEPTQEGLDYWMTRYNRIG